MPENCLPQYNKGAVFSFNLSQYVRDSIRRCINFISCWLIFVVLRSLAELAECLIVNHTSLIGHGHVSSCICFIDIICMYYRCTRTSVFLHVVCHWVCSGFLKNKHSKKYGSNMTHTFTQFHQMIIDVNIQILRDEGGPRTGDLQITIGLLRMVHRHLDVSED